MTVSAYRVTLIAIVVVVAGVPLATGSVVGTTPSVATPFENMHTVTINEVSETDTGNAGNSSVATSNTVSTNWRTVTFIGPTDDRADYELTVTGELAVEHGFGREDTIGESTAYGAVWSGSDSYRYTGQITEIVADGDLRIVFDETWHTITIAGREDGGRTDYSFTADGYLTAAEGIGREDSIEGSTATGAVWSGSDTYRFSGNPDAVRDSLSVDGDAAVYIDGQRTSEAATVSVRYINCTAARITGEFDEVYAHATSNAPDGVATYLGYRTRDELSEGPEGSVIVTTDNINSQGINGSFLDTVRVNDTSPDNESHSERCRREVRPDLDASLVSVTQTDTGTYNVTFSYRNRNDAELTAGNTFRGRIRGAGYEATSPLQPGNHTFSVTWTPASEDERLTWVVLDDDQWVGIETELTVETDAASEY